MNRFNLIVFCSFFIASICLLLPQEVKGQSAPGYLGKKQVFELDVSFNPLLALFDFNEPFDFGNPIGFGATYRRALTSKNLIGLSVSYHSFGVPKQQGEDLKAASSEFAAVVEWQKHKQSVAPLGGAMVYGLGIARFTGVPSSALERTTTDKVSKVSPLFRVGYTYRYIIKDKISITPWARLDLTTFTFGNAFGVEDDFTINQMETGSDPLLPSPAKYVWRTGVSVGLVL